MYLLFIPCESDISVLLMLMFRVLLGTPDRIGAQSKILVLSGSERE